MKYHPTNEATIFVFFKNYTNIILTLPVPHFIKYKQETKETMKRKE